MRRASEASSSPSSRTHTLGAKVSTNVFTSSSVTARGAADMVPGMGGPVSFARCLNYNLDSQSPVDSYSERSPIQVPVEGTPLVRPPTRYAGADTVTRMARAQVMSDTSTGIRRALPSRLVLRAIPRLNLSRDCNFRRSEALSVDWCTPCGGRGIR